MITKINKNQDRLKRHKRVRAKVKGTAETPRLSVYRSLNHIYAQIIDDVKGVTLVTASTLSKELKGTLTKATRRHKHLQLANLSLKRHLQRRSLQLYLTEADIFTPAV